MGSIKPKAILDKLPAERLDESLREYLEPLSEQLPDRRMIGVAQAMVRGIVVSETPLVTQIARGSRRQGVSTWAVCQQLYRLLNNERVSSRMICKGLYGIAQREVERARPEYLLVAVDPVNFEKPYTKKLEGVSTVYKATPPPLDEKRKRLARGYPAITATIVNMRMPLTTYARWFSYEHAEFESQNHEIHRALRVTKALFPGQIVRFVGDSAFDDQKMFEHVAQLSAQFIFHADKARTIEVYNARMDRWESEPLFDLVASVPLAFEQQVLFRHARGERLVTLQFGWFKARIPLTQQELWFLVAHDPLTQHDFVLVTNIPLLTSADARRVYSDFRLRGRIEHTYRFDQEQGLDVEDMRLQSLEAMRRMFAFVLLAMQFVFYIGVTWPAPVLLWVRFLGGKLGLSSDLDGPYILLKGLSDVWRCAASVRFACDPPFLWDPLTCV